MLVNSLIRTSNIISPSYLLSSITEPFPHHSSNLPMSLKRPSYRFPITSLRNSEQAGHTMEEDGQYCSPLPVKNIPSTLYYIIVTHPIVPSNVIPSLAAAFRLNPFAELATHPHRTNPNPRCLWLQARMAVIGTQHAYGHAYVGSWALK